MGDEILHRLSGTHEVALRRLDASEVRRYRLLLFGVVDSCYHKKSVLVLLIVMLSFLLVRCDSWKALVVCGYFI